MRWAKRLLKWLLAPRPTKDVCRECGADVFKGFHLCDECSYALLYTEDYNG